MTDRKKTIKTILLILLIPLVLEVFFFNFRFWESLFFKHSVTFTAGTSSNEIVIGNMDAAVKNIRVDCSGATDAPVVHILMTVTDEANTGYELTETEVIPGISESSYLRIFTDGNAKEIKMAFDPDEVPDAGKINIGLNRIRPFNLHFGRFFFLLVIAVLIFIFRPGSAVYKMPLYPSEQKLSDRNKIYILSFAASFICLWLFIVMAFNLDIWPYYNAGHVDAIYNYQADALLDGHVNLNFDPPKYLSEMENPYDYNARFAMYQKTGEAFKLDFAYFNGQYFSYYGIVPTLLFYLPFIALTGIPLNNSIPIILLGAVFIAFSLMLLYKAAKRFYKDISLGLFFILSTVFIFGTGAFYCAQTPCVYSVAFIAAIAFTVVALYLWLGASDKHFANAKAPLSKVKLVIGAVVMGLAIGSRPVFGMYLFLAFPLFYQEIKEKLFFSKKGLANTACVMLPLMAIGAGLLYFNKLRFGSFFDFGNTYNLSDMDLNHRDPGVERLWLGFFEYLFQPLQITGKFPHVASIFDYKNHATDYLGYMFFDPVYGGYFALCPVCLAIVFLRKCKAELKDMKSYYFAVCSLIFALALLILDIEKTGITLRYQMDFAMFTAMAAVLVLIALFRMSARSSYDKAFKILLTVVILLTAVMVFNNLFIMLADNKIRPLILVNPKLYYSLKYLLFTLR
jgi:hypothetical protein